MNVHLQVDLTVINGKCCLVHGFSQGGVGVDGAGNILTAAIKFHSQNGFSDQFRGHSLRRYERLVSGRCWHQRGFSPCQWFHPLLGRGRWRQKENYLSCNQSFAFQLLFGLAYPGDLGPGVNHPGDGSVIEYGF